MIHVDTDMTITIAGIDFDYRDYDERSDVLYLHVGLPKDPPTYEPGSVLCGRRNAWSPSRETAATVVVVAA
jgi:hypothetical protein